MKPISGQYECVHSSGVGLDYFTSRIDRLTLQTTGRFVLTTQNRSRAVNAAQSLMKGQQVSSAAPETKLEGSYSQQNLVVLLQFDHGGSEQAQLDPDGTGLQIGPNHFNKVSDSTMLPPTHRLQKDMDDIAKGIKIATTIGGMAVKAAKTIQGTIQSVQDASTQQKSAADGTPTPQQSGTPVYQPPAQQQQPATPVYQPPAQQQQPATPVYQPPAQQQQPATPVYQPPAQQQQPATPVYQQPAQQQPASHLETIFCDQCGARIRSGKHFCNSCGARLP